VLSVASPGFIRKVLAAFAARPWSWLGGFVVPVLAIALVYGLSIEPSLAPRTEAALGNPPYLALDARAALEKGKQRAVASGKMLMVTFGANWCPDCLTLHRNLLDAETHAYLEKHFELVTIDVGDAQKSAAVQRDLGIDVTVIPLAAFYWPDGQLVGDTRAGELKPSRHFSSRDIRDFLREVVDYHRIVSPDQRQ
jgi:thiol-disulfide isomerase/thioredoxin